MQLRLHLGSHLAQHLRLILHTQKGYTCTAGISTNKLLSKLVGNLHKPHGQTTLLPPYANDDDELDNVTSFIDNHEVGKIPGIGFKLAQKLRVHVSQGPPKPDDGQADGDTKEAVLVGAVRRHPGMSAESLEQVLGGPGTPHGIGARIWDLLNGCDDTEVGQARDVPRQISIEDSYGRLETFEEVVKQLRILATSLLKRMHMDLLEEDDEILESRATHTGATDNARRRWLAFPKTVRLSTRPRPPQRPDGNRERSMARISRSAPMPNFVFNLKESLDTISDRLVKETLIPLFRQLHPGKGWNLSLINVAATNLVDAASEKGGGAGRDIAKMFQRQDTVLKQFRVEDANEGVEMVEEKVELTTSAPQAKLYESGRSGSEDIITGSQKDNTWDEDRWESEDEDRVEDSFRCDECGAIMPVFAMAAHERFHVEP